MKRRRLHDVTEMKKQFITLVHVMLLTSLSCMVVTLHSEGAKGLSVAGVITSDTVWTLEDSPIEVSGNVTAVSGVTLSVEPGVEIRFGTRSSLIINGSLYAVGTSINRIRFTSNMSEPAVGDWNGIKFCGDENSTFTTSFCDVRYASDGITISGLGRAVIENSVIRDNHLSGIHAIGVTNLLIQKNTIQLNAQGISASGVTASGLKIMDNHFSSNENGVYLYAYGYNCRICNITISHNAFKDNTNGIRFHSHAKPTSEPDKANAYINDVTISDNLMESNEYGIYCLAEAWGKPGLRGGGAYIYSSTISGNNISFSESAIYIDSTSNWYSWISDLFISGNIIHSNDNGILMHAFRTPKPPYLDIPFDVILASNTVSANGIGVKISGDVSANFTGNSVSYNSHGIYLVSSVPSENEARNNDIYQNTEYGVYLVDKASIKAEDNYWGAPTGPNHQTLNPSGEGDRVNGSEENLVLTPFSLQPFGEINDAPFAVIKADRTMVPVNQTILFDGSESTDDSSIIKYFVDFGDGATTQVFPGTARHTYASPGVYNASLVVMDNLGVNSTNTAIATVTVTPPPSLVVSVFLSPLSVVSAGQVVVEVHVSDEVAGVEGASVELASDQDGNFEPSSGLTDSTGDFESVFYAPSVSEPTNVRITVTASKEGYEAGSADACLSVLTPHPGGIWSDSRWIWFVAIIAIVAVAIFVLLRRRCKRNLSFSSGSRTQREKEADAH